MRTRWLEFWTIFRRSTPGVVGLGIVAGMILVAALAGAIASVAPTALSRDSLQPPGPAHWMGTDDLGRDILAGVVYGARISLLVGFLTAGASTVIGICVGGAAGYYGGRLDDLLMRVTEFFMVVPRFFLALVIVALFGASLWGLIVVLAILSWPTTRASSARRSCG